MKYRAIKHKVYHDAREDIELECLTEIQRIRRWDQVDHLVAHQLASPLEASDGIHRHIHSCLGIGVSWDLARS